MRRRRKPLEVSTFPFLAVLLCAMGSLILVLLVMDRKAKMGARAKAQAAYASAVAKTSAEAEKAAAASAAAHKAELERRLQEMRAEWEKKRDALHSKLLTEQQTLQLEMQQLREKMVLAAARLRAEQDQAGDLKKQVETGHNKLQGESKALAASKAMLVDTEKHTEQERAALAKMTNDLVVLEQALRDLKAAREREKQTYSVVPYNGKRGENRRPLYVECTGPSVIFHPDKKALQVLVQHGEIRAEVERRVARQRQQIAAATGASNATPYLMLLVRPDGIVTYYSFQAALAGLNVQFGYELIDEDWLLDFPPDDEHPVTQPWQSIAKQPETAPPDAVKPGAPNVRGVQTGGSAVPLPPLDPNRQLGSAFPRRTPGAPGTGYMGPGMQSDNGMSPGGLGRPVAVGSYMGTGNAGNGNSPPGSPSDPGAGPMRGFRGGSSDLTNGSGPALAGGPGFGNPGTGPSGQAGQPGSAVRGNGGPMNGQPGNGQPGSPTALAQGGTPVGMGMSPGNAVSGSGNPGGAIANYPPQTSLAQAGGTGGAPSGPWNTGNGNGNQGGPRDSSPGSPSGTAGQTQGGAPTQTPSGPGGTGNGGGSPLVNGTQPGGTPPNGTHPGGSPSYGTPQPGGTPPNGTQPGGSPPYGSPQPGGTPVNGAQVGGLPPLGTPPGEAPPVGSIPPSDPSLPPLDAAVARNTAPAVPRRPGYPTGEPGDGDQQGGSQPFSSPALEPKRPRPPLRAARLSGDRDYLIYIECKPDGVLLYPSQKLFPFASLINGRNSPLVQSVQQMIDRRQAGVRPGEAPYRPQLRFLVRPEMLRAYHAAYPLFDGLPIPQSRQNLIPEDDVLSIIAGQR